ncbi:MAG: aspartate/glutamate racemase family protein [Bdellovibrionales bacterium]|nr:aspartate/glutamate racemase family protein [Bdellovibrionales bacterium]
MIQQKVIGLIGGMSWESTAVYYHLLNQGIKERLGGLHSADCIVRSLDFSTIERLQQQGAWTAAAELLSREGKKLEAFGAQALVLCTNTMHKVAHTIQGSCHIPLLHIADGVGRALVHCGIRQVLLTGTRFTMEDSFYCEYLTENYDLVVSTPREDHRQEVNRIIYEELCRGEVREDSRKFFVNVISAGAENGDQGVILGCTELQMLTAAIAPPIPAFDSTALHVQSILDWSLSRPAS